MSWSFTTLKEICSPKQHKTISTSELLDSGYPIFGANGQIGYYSQYTHERETIAITCRGATCGTINIAPEKCYINGNAMALDDLREDKVNLRFLAYFFSYRGLNDVISGSAQPQITRAPLLNLQIPLPPLEEQKRIAAILDQADALRRLRQRSIDRLNSLGQAIFYEMFGDPVSNPMGWPVMKLGEIGNLDRGVSKHRPRNDPKLLGGIYPLIQTGDISNADRYVCTHTSTYSDLGLKQSKLWPAGTLCITIAANIGKTAILGFEACFPDSVVGFSPKDQVNTEYVQYWMDFIQRRLEEVAPQSAQKNINLAILRDLPIPVPPIEQQNKFRDILFEIKEQKTHFGNSEQFYINLFDSLQHKAFNGELSGNIDAECQALREAVSV